MEIIKLTNKPEKKRAYAHWFHAKWGMPLEAYMASMDQCLSSPSGVPSWYAAEIDGQIVGGLGVIENDYHDRKDLAPNVCAIFVEPEYRGQGIAGKLLEYVCEDMRERGIKTLYLVTDHDSFYERYGWKFFTFVNSEGQTDMSRLYIHEAD